jgi:tRNA pseudouridine38-40 synthase
VPGRQSGGQTRKPMIPRRNIKLVLGFDGTAYHGWQIQECQKTVQGELRVAIGKIVGEDVMPIGSGRTDAGTHARALVASFVTSSRIPAGALVRALNSVLPPDIRIFSARAVAAGFHARASALSKTYRYQIYRGPVLPPHLAREHFHYPYPVDLELMKRGAELLVGTHDFASFAARGGAGKKTVRHIFRCGFRSLGHRLIFTVEGNGFLHHMVRNMVGTLLELGRGQLSLDRVAALFELRDRTLAGFTAPAHGLILVKVQYGSTRQSG